MENRHIVNNRKDDLHGDDIENPRTTHERKYY